MENVFQNMIENPGKMKEKCLRFDYINIKKILYGKNKIKQNNKHQQKDK